MSVFLLFGFKPFSIFMQKDIYKIKGKCELTDIKKFDPNESRNIQPLTAANPTPKSTFRLELNQNEEKARSQVVLPYIRFILTSYLR